MRYVREKLFNLQSLLGKVLVSNYCKTKVYEEQLIATEQIGVFWWLLRSD